jgi:hypothetical protein
MGEPRINPDTGMFRKVNTPLGGIGMIDVFQSITYGASTFAANNSYPFLCWPNDGSTWKIVQASARYTTKSTSANTFQIEVAGAGTAPGSGTNQLTAGIPLGSTANTNYNGTLITNPTPITAGSAINFVVANTNATTGLVGLVISMTLERIA